MILHVVEMHNYQSIITNKPIISYTMYTQNSLKRHKQNGELPKNSTNDKNNVGCPYGNILKMAK